MFTRSFVYEQAFFRKGRRVRYLEDMHCHICEIIDKVYELSILYILKLLL